MRNLMLLALLMGCNSEPDGDTDGTDTLDLGGDTDEDTESPVQTDCVDDDALDGTPMLKGMVLDEDGNPASKKVTAVRYCNGDTCIPAQFQTCDGAYAMVGLPSGTGTLEAVPIGDEHSFATVLTIIPIDASTSDRTVDMTVPTLSHTSALSDSPTEHQVADGFWLTVSAPELIRPSPLEPAATEVGGVDATAIAPEMEGLTGTIEGVFYLSPFDFHTDNPMPLRLTNTWGYADGEAELWVARYAADWELVGDLVDDGNGDLTVSGPGLTLLSTVAVVRK